MWKATSRLKQPKQQVPPLRKKNGKWAHSDEDKATEFANHLSEVFQPFKSVLDSKVDDDITTFLDYYFFIKVLGTTGARLSEFQQFTWEDIISGEVTLRGKGNKYRRFFFQKQLQQEAKAYAKEHGKTGIFAVGRFGPITQRGFSQHLKAWGKHCGIDSRKMHAHAFRHFFAKMFLKKNKDVIQLADLLGHGSVDTTRIYLQKSYDEQKRDFNRNVTW